ncbi:MAG TPA: hypothetical protein PLJ27_02385 [Polyangiaceae bacterium]|nr:MAG: hypothetical protein BWY17_03515 [Deltaproteobacteria bacterium ADurb.Bin207]HNS97522.1 hypothetical protein [Polyangiaceae bacterium]HNZ21935.1 hypothetical protein [Polyangiaceae bacterium]HOD23386.1 hypothetical protein [Polyangiaceae bacterium]HOE49328.1 hypothetical protein [Polyangiaceae bacterium]
MGLDGGENGFSQRDWASKLVQSSEETEQERLPGGDLLQAYAPRQCILGHHGTALN